MHDKRPDIQGLRAWAVISVVIFHFFPSLLPYGYLGVDVFFVLSGLLITLVLEGRPTGLSTYNNFYFKRSRRILPLALLVVFLCVLTISFLQSGYEFTNGMKSALYSTFFVKNMQPHPSLEDDYFQQPNTDKAVSSFAFMTVISAGSLLYSMVCNPQDAFDSTPARLWQFLAGAMAFHTDLMLSGWSTLSDAGKDNNDDSVHSAKKALYIPAIFAITTTVAVLYTGDWEITLRFYTTFLIALVLALARSAKAILAGDRKIPTHRKVLALRSKSVLLCHGSLQLIGDVSYSLYLIHWPIVCVLDIIEIDAWQWKVVAMMAALGLAVICYFGFEKRYLTLPTKSTFFLILGLYIAIFAAVGASAYNHFSDTEQDSNITLLPLKLEQNQTFVELSQEEIDERNAKLSHNSLKYTDCTIISGSNPIGFCDLKNGTGSLHFLILGNNYAPNLGGLIVKHFGEHYGKLQARAIAQCEPLVPTRKDRFCPDYRTAHAKFDADIDRERPDVLYINPNEPIEQPIENDTEFRIMESRLKYFEDRVNKKVFILQAFPRPARADDLEKEMKDKGLPMMPYMPEAVELDAKPMKGRVRTLSERCKKCVIFDIEDAFLNEAGNFTVLSPQNLRYFDQARHLNSLGLQLVEPVFERLGNNFNSLLNSKYPNNIF